MKFLIVIFRHSDKVFFIKLTNTLFFRQDLSARGGFTGLFGFLFFTLSTSTLRHVDEPFGKLMVLSTVEGLMSSRSLPKGGRKIERLIHFYSFS